MFLVLFFWRQVLFQNIFSLSCVKLALHCGMSLVHGPNVPADFILNACPVKYCCEVIFRNASPANLLDVDGQNKAEKIEDEHGCVIKSFIVVSSTDNVDAIFSSVGHALEVGVSAHSLFFFEDDRLVAYFAPGFGNQFPPFGPSLHRYSLTFRAEPETFQLVVKHADLYFCKQPSPVRKYGENTNWQHAMVVVIEVDWHWTVGEIIMHACESIRLPEDRRAGMGLCHFYKNTRRVLDDRDAKLAEYFFTGNFPIFQHTYAYCARNMELELVLVHMA